MKPLLLALLGPLFCILPGTGYAVDFAVSGFGTLGYAVSDQPFNYQRFIDNTGTLTRDSLFGVQLDTQFTPQWSTTVQAKVAPSIKNDSRWDATLSWAFLSWRPSNDWLIRAGKLRVPGYLNSENLDVGATLDLARQPLEVYATSPIVDMTGASFNKTWGFENSELSLDGYWGKGKTELRIHVRDGIPGLLAAGANFTPLNAEGTGLLLTYRPGESVYRVGYHLASVERTDGQEWLEDPNFVALAPGIGYYNFQPGPGIRSTKSLDFTLFNLGADLDLGQNIRLTTEYARRRSTTGNGGGIDTDGGYVSLRKRIGKWTPYLYWASLRTESASLERYQTFNTATVPAALVGPAAAVINASQRAGADFDQAFDQDSWAIGTSYALSSTQKIKTEWVRTRVGVASSLVDAPAGGNVSHKSIHVFSLSYSFVF